MLTCAQVAALDGAQVLLVALAVAVVLVQHVGVARLNLGLKDSEPQLLGTNHLARTALLLIPAGSNQRWVDVVVREAWMLRSAVMGAVGTGGYKSNLARRGKAGACRATWMGKVVGRDSHGAEEPVNIVIGKARHHASLLHHQRVPTGAQQALSAS